MELGQRDRDYEADIYGSGFKESEVAFPEKFTEHGFVTPEEFIRGVKSDFGLVWDGDSLDSCTGDFGSYLSINTPHKTSLYIRAGLPVIVWSGSAMAGFVMEKGIGFTVDRLEDINDLAGSVTPDEYARMKMNVEKVASDMARGEYFKRAYKEAVKGLETGA